MKSAPYLVYLGFALNVNYTSVQSIHNKITLKVINHSKMLVLFYTNAHVPFSSTLQQKLKWVEIDTCPKCKSLIRFSIYQQMNFCWIITSVKVRRTNELTIWESNLSDFWQPCKRSFISTSIGEIHFYTNSPRANEFLVQWSSATNLASRSS